MRYMLLESGARRERHPAGTMVSILLHGGAIALAIGATTREVHPAENPTTQQTLVYAAPPRTVTPAAARTGRTAATRSTIDITRVRPTFIAPVHVPHGITAVDLSTTLTNQHLFDGGAAALGGSASTGGDGALGGPADGVWSASRVDKAVMGRRGNPTPQYPEALRAAQIEGEVLAHFVVDSTGRVEPGSIILLESPNVRFDDAVRTALLASRYYPAEVDGRKVRQLVEQRFAFRLER